ncbi:uncharacterized protein LOC119604108 [Lucilia sericata]|uniref:uncharacterized protein LOC119604108 n=1 Tax=Lucilia sericata TaxID=13632 RepID=UPI0018A7EAFA|nr:uncharacterized protein LOC119604108 [Lucilia sericata]
MEQKMENKIKEQKFDSHSITTSVASSIVTSFKNKTLNPSPSSISKFTTKLSSAKITVSTKNVDEKTNKSTLISSNSPIKVQTYLPKINKIQKDRSAAENDLPIVHLKKLPAISSNSFYKSSIVPHETKHSYDEIYFII